MSVSGLEAGPSGNEPRERVSLRRRDQVIMAAIEVLAEHGVRGLTHRQVDRQLDWPLGSTSNHFRRRNDMLVAITERIMQIDLQDLAIVGETSRYDGMTVTVLTERLCDLIETWMQPAARSRTVARAEILFESTRNPDVRRATEQQIGVVEVLFARVFTALGSADPLASANFLEVLMTGISAGVCVNNLKLGRHQLEVLVQAWIESAVRQNAG